MRHRETPPLPPGFVIVGREMDERGCQEAEIDFTYAITEFEFEAAAMGETVVAIAAENGVTLDPVSWLFAYASERCLADGIVPGPLWQELEMSGAVGRIVERMEVAR